MKIICRSLFLFALLGAGCGAGAKDAKEPADVSPGGTAEIADQEKDQTINRDAAASGITGGISRIDLNKVLASGPAALLAEVLTDPVRENGRFIGFRITKFRNGEPKSINLKEGDVILLVNGRKVERPENYFEIFEALKIEREIRFKILRNGEEIELVYPIAD